MDDLVEVMAGLLLVSLGLVGAGGKEEVLNPLRLDLLHLKLL